MTHEHAHAGGAYFRRFHFICAATTRPVKITSPVVIGTPVLRNREPCSRTATHSRDDKPPSDSHRALAVFLWTTSIATTPPLTASLDVKSAPSRCLHSPDTTPSAAIENSGWRHLRRIRTNSISKGRQRAGGTPLLALGNAYHAAAGRLCCEFHEANCAPLL
jgi:hypothetical protein